MAIKDSFFDIEIPWLLIRKIKSIHLWICFLLFLLVSSCKPSETSHSHILSPEDHRSLKSLFSHLLFYENGAYTLFGSKPITFETLSVVPEEEKKECLTFSSHPAINAMLSFSENWNTWERLKNQYITPRFLLFQRNSPSFSPERQSIFLVNITATVSMLQKHYEKFRAAVAEDFDPLDIIFEIQDNHSKFWNKVFDREDLFGMLLGFGEENSWFFVKVKSWEELNNHEKNSKDRYMRSLTQQTPGSNSLASFDPSFPLPGFLCYAEQESLKLIKQYEAERRYIKKIYQGKDLVEITLNKLTSRDLSSDPDKLYRKKMTKELGLPQGH